MRPLHLDRDLIRLYIERETFNYETKLRQEAGEIRNTSVILIRGLWGCQDDSDWDRYFLLYLNLYEYVLITTCTSTMTMSSIMRSN